MKNLLLITSDKVGDTGRVSFAYIFQDRELKAFERYPSQCAGAFGFATILNGNCLHFNLFEGGVGFKMGGPVVSIGYDSDFIQELPDNFNMLCTSEVAEMVKKEWGSLMNIEVIKSEQTLLTA